MTSETRGLGVRDTGWGVVWHEVDVEEIMSRQREHLHNPEPRGDGTGRDTGSRVRQRPRSLGGKFKATRMMAPSRSFS